MYTRYIYFCTNIARTTSRVFMIGLTPNTPVTRAESSPCLPCFAVHCVEIHSFPCYIYQSMFAVAAFLQFMPG